MKGTQLRLLFHTYSTWIGPFHGVNVSIPVLRSSATSSESRLSGGFGDGLEWFQSRWHNPQDVWMGIHINHCKKKWNPHTFSFSSVGSSGTLRVERISLSEGHVVRITKTRHSQKDHKPESTSTSRLGPPTSITLVHHAQEMCFFPSPVRFIKQAR